MEPDLKKILIVEDSELLHKAYELALRRYVTRGCQLIKAYNGFEGQKELSRHSNCDLIISDINMPQMSGLEFIKGCKTRAKYRYIPIIIVSSRGADDDIIRGIEAGADVYLVKPFDVDDLHRLIKKLVAPKLTQTAEAV